MINISWVKYLGLEIAGFDALPLLSGKLVRI